MPVERLPITTHWVEIIGHGMTRKGQSCSVPR